MVFLLSIGNNGRQKKVVKRAEETAEDDSDVVSVDIDAVIAKQEAEEN